jgi:hypothetical protein
MGPGWGYAASTNWCNALILDGEKERTMDLRQNPLPGCESEEEE